MSWVIQRQKSSTQSTQGELRIDGQHECFTLEPAIAIDAGTYILSIYWSHHFGRRMPHVDGVPGHSGIEIHWGNWSEDTEDCTLVGTIEEQDFVGHSVEEFNLLFQKIQDAIDSNGGPINIAYLDPPSVADLDGEIAT